MVSGQCRSVVTVGQCQYWSVVSVGQWSPSVSVECWSVVLGFTGGNRPDFSLLVWVTFGVVFGKRSMFNNPKLFQRLVR